MDTGAAIIVLSDGSALMFDAQRVMIANESKRVRCIHKSGAERQTG